MTPEEQQIAIAEACGWKEVGVRIKSNLLAPSYLRGIPPNPDINIDWEINSLPIPDYLNDLNAMHEAEKILSVGQIDNYTSFIRETAPCGKGVFFNLVHATATQRAEAFLRALSLWK